MWSRSVAEQDALLRGLKLHNINLTAIVTVANDGGSTGRIRSVFNAYLPATSELLYWLTMNPSWDTFPLPFRRGSLNSPATRSETFFFITAMTQVTGGFRQGVIGSCPRPERCVVASSRRQQEHHSVPI